MKDALARELSLWDAKPIEKIYADRVRAICVAGEYINHILGVRAVTDDGMEKLIRRFKKLGM